MAQFAPVAPIQLLEEMKARKCLGTYHLLLAHHVLEFPDRFRALFADLKGCTIIMDNSLVELGDSEGEAKVLEACQAIQGPYTTNPNWVIPVLTDVMGDGAATREKAEASYTWWQENAPDYPLMVVAQGGFNGDDPETLPKDPSKEIWHDFCLTVDKFLIGNNFPGIRYVGIPRFLVGLLGTRQLAVQYVDAVRPDISTHLLGFSDDVTDDVITAQHRSVEGIDSAVPIRFSYGGEDAPNTALYTPTAAIPPRPKDWFEKAVWDDTIEKNLFNIRQWVG